VVGGLAQPDAYSAADDDVFDLGALTASSAWIYNQIGANLTGHGSSGPRISACS
jgi:hypothetical protein